MSAALAKGPKVLAFTHVSNVLGTVNDVVAITAFSLTEPDFYSAHEELVALPRFTETYERIGVVRNDWYQDRSYWVFVRRGMLPDGQQLATFPTGIEKP